MKVSMQKYKICLVNPLKQNNPALCFGIGYLASYLMKYGKHKYEIKIADENPGKNALKIIEDFKPDFVGITATTVQYPRAMEIATLIKAHNRSIPIVIGGVHVSALPERTLRESNFDIGVIGEGEETFLELVDYCIDCGGTPTIEGLRKIRGLAFKDQGKIAVNEPRPLIENVDTIPFPARELFDMDFYLRPRLLIRGYWPLRTTNIFTSLGCPNDCTYCGSKVIHKRRFRPHSPEYVISEISELVEKYRVEGLYFHDDLFIANKKRVETICRLLIERKLADKIIWACQGRANLISDNDLELLRLMKKAGCIQLEYGFESGSDHALGLLKNNVTVAQNQKAIDITKKVGLRIFGNFMLGMQGETEQDMSRTRDFILKNIDNLDHFQSYITTPYPGTKLWDICTKKGLLQINSWKDLSMGGEWSILAGTGRVFTDTVPANIVWKFLREMNYLGNMKIKMGTKLNYVVKDGFRNPHMLIRLSILYLQDIIKFNVVDRLKGSIKPRNRR